MSFKPLSLAFAALLLLQCSPPAKKTAQTKRDKTEIAVYSEITCPKCGYTKTEKLPTDVCLIRYQCEKCKTEMTPKSGDCCVFCTYGTHKCPSMQ